MPEICFYEPWTYQLALPEKIEAYLNNVREHELFLQNVKNDKTLDCKEKKNQL